jgi:hypothetical protein
MVINLTTSVNQRTTVYGQQNRTMPSQTSIILYYRKNDTAYITRGNKDSCEKIFVLTTNHPISIAITFSIGRL